MSSETYDPKTERLFQTKQGVTAVPRAQEGVPFKEYFANTEMPKDLERARVYATDKGPVLAKPDPEAWCETHQARADQFAEKLRAQIEEKGYYAKSLRLYSEQLAEQTGSEPSEMKAVIAKSFEAQTGKEPYAYLQDHRAAQGLPTRDRAEQSYGPERQ